IGAPRTIGSQSTQRSGRSARGLARTHVAQAPLRSARRTFLRHAGGDAEGIAVVELAQNIIRQVDAVQLPERVIRTIVVEVVVVGLEHAPEVRILTGLDRVLAEQYPVLVPDEELACGARLTSDVVEHCTDF